MFIFVRILNTHTQLRIMYLTIMQYVSLLSIHMDIQTTSHPERRNSRGEIFD